MNKLNAIAAMGFALNVGMQITSNVWNPQPDKILFAVLYTLLSVFWLIRIKETPKPTKETDETYQSTNQKQSK